MDDPITISKPEAKQFILLFLIGVLVLACMARGTNPTPILSSVLLPTDSHHGVGDANTGSVPPAISNVVTNKANLAPFEKLETRFDVRTTATQLDLPYDPTPPPGLPAGTGINVEALFSPDNWVTVITQPAFLHQPHTYTVRGNRDHFTPNGPAQWVVRFAPQRTGAWQYRLRAQDANGTIVYPTNGAMQFNVSGQSTNPYTRRGFLRASQRDRRYFEFNDGSPFIGAGYNAGFGQTNAAEQTMQRYEQYKMNFMRVWMSGAGINGSQWTSWGWPDQPWDGYLPAVQFDTRNTFNGADVALKLDGNNRCYFTDFWQGGIPVEPNTTYRVSTRVKLEGVTGSGNYGFAVKQGGWPEGSCNGQTLITPYQTGSTGWITVTGLYTTSDAEYWLDYLYLARDNVASGTIYIDEVRVWRENDPYQVNLLREPNANSHLYFDSMNAAEWDEYIEAAGRHGVYLKIVIDEKNEWIKNHLGADGKMTDDGSNDHFYATPNTKVRWLQQAWWRYLIARWGYSTAIHSFEYVNEGDPYNGNHYEAANAMARYFKQHDPARHMVTTSFWHSFPASDFWARPEYSDVDYADLHAYVSTGWGRDASFIDAAQVETRTAYVHSGMHSEGTPASFHIAGATQLSKQITPRGLVIRGPGEWIIRYWMKASAYTSSCAPDAGQQRLRWFIDGGNYWGGREGVVPSGGQADTWACSAPTGTFDWTQFRSDRDGSNNLLPEPVRLILTDAEPHEIALIIENYNGTGGNAWIDDVELVSPAGKVVPVIGQFDITPMDDDTAWYNRAYGELFGGRSPVGAQKPIVRGETGVDSPEQQEWNRAINNDTTGIWLHNNLWGQVNPGGMIDLFWWATETIDQNTSTGRYTHIYTNYLTYRNFMEDIPINNGLYRDAQAQTSDKNLRAWGQRDDVNGRMHLWVQNTQHTWKRVVNGPAIPAITGTITIPNVPVGRYRVTWWDTYSTTNPIFLTQQTYVAAQELVLALPAPLKTDVGIKIERIVDAGLPRSRLAFIPLVAPSR
ncbi:MAG: hypothetical protein M1546_11370 [Chloroflexi bacterium]|nr:hypothetical protein [Chloroflexota bacterium]